MSIKLVAVDIDGTLLTNDRKITPEVFEAVRDAVIANACVLILSDILDFLAVNRRAVIKRQNPVRYVKN